MMLKLEFSPRVLSMISWGFFFWGGGGGGGGGGVGHHGNYWAGLFKARLSKPWISQNFDFSFVTFWCGVLFILFAL